MSLEAPKAIFATDQKCSVKIKQTKSNAMIRAEGSSAMGDGGQAAISLKPDIDAMHVCILGILQLEGSYVGDLLYTPI